MGVKGETSSNGTTNLQNNDLILINESRLDVDEHEIFYLHAEPPFGERKATIFLLHDQINDASVWVIESETMQVGITSI